MKRLLLFIFSLSLFLFSFLPQSSSQNMLEEGHQWNIVNGPGYTIFPFTYTILAQIEGDTIVNNVTYKKLYSTEDSLGQSGKKRIGILREDGNGKVFLLNGNDEEELLYDFSLLPGDTLTIENYCDCNLVVDSTDFITLKNGEMRKRLFLSASFGFGVQDIWIEGMGSITSNLLNPALHLFLADGGRSSLLCFYRDGELLYPENPEFCYITSNPREPLEERVTIYPNPTSDLLFIEDRSRGNSILEVRWYDSSGRFIRRETSEDRIRKSSLAEFPRGVYFLELIGKDGSDCIKRVVKK